MNNIYTAYAMIAETFLGKY